MAKPLSSKRFRINPVELAIFSVVTLMCLNSVYNLFYDSQGFHATALAPMAASPVTETGRSPASIKQAFVNLDVGCEMETTKDLLATKVRLTGPICGNSVGAESAKLLKTQITNNANKFAATVFTDLTSNKYSTDYIPLNQGANPIHVEFVYQGGRVVTQNLTVNKN